MIGTIIANEAYRPRRGYYYDDYAYDGPYYYPSGYTGDPRAVCAEFSLLRVAHGPLHDARGRETALPLPEVARASPSD